VFRRLDVRTRREIARVRLALKAMRGDFDQVQPAGADARHRVQALRAGDT
jgi:hypothetical protein